MPEISFAALGALAAAAAAGFFAAFFIRGAALSAVKKENRKLGENLEKLSEKGEELLSENSELRKNVALREQEIRIKSERLEELGGANAELAFRVSSLEEKLRRAEANSAATEESNKNLREWINGAKESLRDSFAGISKDITENNTKVFLETANDKVGGIMTPMSRELGELRAKVEELEAKRASAYSGLTEKVENLSKQNAELKGATDLLNATLKNNAQRGKWGEEQLRRIAELAGMVDHIDFLEQASNLEGTRPDMVIHLTGGRTVPVDSKVPMNSYLLYLEDTDEKQRSAHLAEHAKALRMHIDTLWRKAYWKAEERSTEMVAMVVPYESGLSAAFAADKEIFGYAMEKNVLLLSPMTFYAFLKSVSTGWQENALSKNAREIAKQSRELIDRFGVFFGYFEKIEKSLEGAREAYDRALASYNRRLLPTFNRIEVLSAGTESDPEADFESAPKLPPAEE